MPPTGYPYGPHGVIGGGGGNGTNIFPTNPPSPVGGGGAGICIILVVRCAGSVSVFHFEVGDNPWMTLAHSWPTNPKCDAIVCGGDDTPGSNCLADEVIVPPKPTSTWWVCQGRQIVA